jgi:hypothetical protein
MAFWADFEDIGMVLNWTKLVAVGYKLSILKGF